VVPSRTRGTTEPSVPDEASLSAYRDSLIRYCEHLGATRQDAEDVVHTTLLKALMAVRAGVRHPNVPAWLRRIAKNSWIDHVRKHSLSHPYGPSELAVRTESAFQSEWAELEEALQILLTRLTPRQRMVFLLCEAFQYTDRETSELLGISREAVKAALHRARSRLAEVRRDGEGAYEGAEARAQQEVLQAYVAAFRAADIRALLQLCQGGGLDPAHATCQVLTRMCGEPSGMERRRDGRGPALAAA
jgi:RNA polymerase sigma factor (sigma-70 family)